jgi:hypothetical protein
MLAPAPTLCRPINSDVSFTSPRLTARWRRGLAEGEYKRGDPLAARWVLRNGEALGEKLWVWRGLERGDDADTLRRSADDAEWELLRGLGEKELEERR